MIMSETGFEDDLYHERQPNICATIRSKSKQCCNIKNLTRFLPLIEWLPKYEKKFLLADIVAGLTVGLTTIPQAIAYGSLAGLPPQYGLYSAFMGCFVYIFFGTCKDITVGPTAILALMVKPHVAGSPDYAVLACFMTGCVILLMGLFNLGILVRFISVPVATGFTMAAAITIASGQINNLFGISSSSNEFLNSWINLFKHITEIRLNDSILGVCTFVFLLLMRKLTVIPCGCPNLLKYISLSRNAFAVLVGILLCYFISDKNNELPFRVNGRIITGIPPFQLPPFNTKVNGITYNFGQMLEHLGASFVSIPLIAILESIAIAKAFSKGKIVNATQEMIALGFCNILGSFVSSFPVTGSFTRTAINNASGVKSPLGGAITGILMLLTLAFLTSTFFYIPKATLSAIIISAMIFMVDYDRIAEIYRAKKIDILIFSVTVSCCLFWSFEYGIICGIFFNMLFILHKSMIPNATMMLEKINNSTACVITIKNRIDYVAAEKMKTMIMSYVTSAGCSTNIVIIAGSEITTIDSTVALNLCSLREDLLLLKCELICWNWSVEAAGVVCRLRKDARNMFKFTKNMSDVIDEMGASSLMVA